MHILHDKYKGCLQQVCVRQRGGGERGRDSDRDRHRSCESSWCWRAHITPVMNLHFFPAPMLGDSKLQRSSRSSFTSGISGRGSIHTQTPSTHKEVNFKDK